MSILSLEDYVRIRQTAEDSKGGENLSKKTIFAQQKESQLAKARDHLRRIKEYDAKKRSPFFCQTTRAEEAKKRKILLFAEKCKEDGLDLTKRMDRILNYAKAVMIRDEQKEMNKRIKNELKKKEEKLDLIMELERLKGLKKEEEEKKMKQLKRIAEKKIIIEQMKDKKIRKEKEKQLILKEGEVLQKHLKELEQNDILLEQKKLLEKKNLAKEIVEKNRISALYKEKLLQQEKDYDLKILKYNMEKSKKEEEEILLKKRQQLQKEIETQKLREKQEKISDNRILLDELRARRYTEEIKKKERQEQLNEAMKIIKQKKELIEVNEELKQNKKNRMIQQALSEEKEYEEMIKHQLKEKEEEKRIELLKKKAHEANGKDVIKQIREKREKKMFLQRYKLEEGRIMEQERENYFRTLQRIKDQKLQEMEKCGIKPIYRVDLEKIKVV